jgi:hypothetical protein
MILLTIFKKVTDVTDVTVPREQHKKGMVKESQLHGKLAAT